MTVAQERDATQNRTVRQIERAIEDLAANLQVLRSSVEHLRRSMDSSRQGWFQEQQKQELDGDPATTEGVASSND